MFYLRYLSAEQRRRKGRTTLTALGLAVGVGMVAIVVALSKRLDDAQSKVLAPLKRVGTDGTGKGMTPVRLLALIVALAVLAVSAASCGGTATVTPSTTATVAGASPPPKLSKQRQARKRALTKLARCMRAHGASFPDPTPDGRIAGGMATVAAAINGPNGQQALSACSSYVLAVQKTLGGADGP